MKLKLLILGFVFSSYIINAQSFDILKYGAIGNGKTLNTEAVQKALDTCNLASPVNAKAYPVSLTNGQGFATDFQTKLINKNNVK
jgi:polygalacturonase